jgi:serine/threonine-protein kinase
VWSKLLRALAVAVYGGLVVAAFAVSAYLSFNVFVRRGVTKVPDLVGLDAERARSLISDQGLDPRHEEGSDRYDARVPPGHVMRQDPGPGSLVKRGSEVEITLSLGPRLIRVPDLAGQALTAAQVTLGGAGLSIGRTASVYSGAGAPGTVIEQEPDPGTLVEQSAPVDLIVTLETLTETYLMPDLIYRDHEEVRRFFDGRGMRMGNVKFETYEGIAPGVILRQFPLAGHPLRRNDVISLVVATTEGLRP